MHPKRGGECVCMRRPTGAAVAASATRSAVAKDACNSVSRSVTIGVTLKENAMAERYTSTMASPLFCEGVHHAEVSTPMWGTDVPDPMGFLSTSPPSAQITNYGSGDDVNDWKEGFPDEA